ncbi:MAG: apolipoprotein N-acyltransferase [Burkholderiaceae bacterium]
MPGSAPAKAILWRAAAALLIGIAHGLSFSPVASGLAQLILFAAAWLLVTGIGRVPAVVGWRPALVIGWAFGVGHFVAGIGWIYISMHDIGGLPAPLAALAVLLLSAYLAAFGACAFALTKRLAGTSLAAIGVLAASWTLVEWLRAVLFTGFPWLAIGYAHVDSWLIGLAPWLGVWGVTFVAVASAGALANLFAIAFERPPRPRAIALRVALPMLLAAIALGGGRIELTRPTGQAMRVRLLQGNVPQAMKFEPRRAVQAMNDYIDAIAAEPADLIVLPETAFTVPWVSVPPVIRQRLHDAQRQAGALVSVGIPMPVDERQRERQPRAHLTNSVITLDETGRIVHRYDKRHLVPFGEFVPPGFRWFVNLMNIPLGDFGRGQAHQALLTVAGNALAFDICYEDLFADEMREQVLDGANILVNVSNIGWFGRSHAVTQHLNISRMRARELGRPLLRATNTGATAAIDADGRVTAILPYHEPGSLTATVRGRAGLTGYARWGDTPMLLLALVITLAGLAGARARRRPRAA